jgi:tRNA (cmo5U34)-methyltransferase
MTTSLSEKSTVDETRERFDSDVERFSNLETGEAATIDAPLAMELVTEAALVAAPTIRRSLDIGCGAGNNTIRFLRAYEGEIAGDHCDLSRPMLERAQERVSAESDGQPPALAGAGHHLEG